MIVRRFFTAEHRGRHSFFMGWITLCTVWALLMCIPSAECSAQAGRATSENQPQSHPQNATGYMRLTINGTNVNVRPQPFAAGRVLARMQTGDVFIAEKQPVVVEQGKSEWYKIVLAVDSATNGMCEMSQWDPRLTATVAFVHADYADASPLLAGDMDKIGATPAGGAGYPSDRVFSSWSYAYSTEGNRETPYHFSEYDYNPPWINLYATNTFSAQFYETNLHGTLVKTGDNSYRLKDAKGWSEGEQYEQEINDDFRFISASGMLRQTKTIAGEPDIHHYYAPFAPRYASSGEPPKVEPSIYDTPDFDNTGHRDELRAASENRTFKVIHDRTVATLTANHQNWFRSNPGFELILTAKGNLFDNGGDGDHAFVAYDKTKSIITIIVYDETANTYSQLYREIQVESGLPCNYYNYGTLDYILGGCILESAKFIRDDPAYVQDEELIGINDIGHYMLDAGCFALDFRMRRPLWVLSIATSTIYNNRECLMYDRERNLLKVVYGQAFSD